MKTLLHEIRQNPLLWLLVLMVSLIFATTLFLLPPHVSPRFGVL